MEDHTPDTAEESLVEIDTSGKAEKRMMKPVRQFFRRKIKREKFQEKEELPDMEVKIQPAMARLTDELIEETSGENGTLVKAFREQLRYYDPERNPLGPYEARAILLSMLDMAASKRKLLNERLEQSVEIGDLYKHYYSRVDEVTNLAVQAVTDLERMDLAEEDYRYYYAMYLNVRDASVVQDIQPRNEYLKKLMEVRTKMLNRCNDIMLELKKRGED